MEEGQIEIQDWSIQTEEEQGKVVDKQTSSKCAHQIGVKDQNVSFDRCPKHQRDRTVPNPIVDELPQETKRRREERNVCGDGVTHGQGQIDGQVDQIVDQQTDDHVVMKSTTSVFMHQNMIHDEEITRRSEDLTDEKQGELDFDPCLGNWMLCHFNIVHRQGDGVHRRRGRFHCCALETMLVSNVPSRCG